MSAAWIEALGPRGGPLVSAALRFLHVHPGAPPLPMPRGAEGLRRLAHAIDAWAERDPEPDVQDEEAFLEGAGALLSCVLLDHIPSGRHAAKASAHRLKLGHGFFDPFRAIESALEGPDARAVLIEEVARAEAEAEGRDGIGRALRILEARLAALRPDLAIRDAFEATVQLEDGIELDLARVLSATEGESEAAVERAIDKLVSMLPGGSGRAMPAWDELRGALLPRLVSAELLAQIASDPARGELAVRTLLDGALSVALIVGYEGRARYVRKDEVERWPVSAAEAYAVALANLAERSHKARFARVDTSLGPWVVARTGDGLDGARLLLPTLHDVLAPELGSPFLAAVPHRDALLTCAIEPPELGAALARRAQDDAARAPHRIDARLFVIGPSGLARVHRG
jgi:hypothetical protein